MLKLDMVLFFYDCDLAIAPSSIDGYLSFGKNSRWVNCRRRLDHFAHISFSLMEG